MSKPRSENEAPLTRLQKILEPYFSGSPSTEAFAPGVLDEYALVPMQLSEETPWRGPSGPVPDPAKHEKRRRGKKKSSDAQWSSETPISEALQLPAGTLSPTQVPAPDPLQILLPPQPPDERKTPARTQSKAQQGKTKGGTDRVPADAGPTHDFELARIPAPPSEAGVPDAPPTSIRVLVVHPNLSTRRQVAAALGELGIEVSTCGEAEQAVLQLLHDRPDAVVSEIGMPELDALALCRRITECGTETPVLLVAPGDDEADYSLAMESGAADYLRRPLTPEFLGERLRVAVQAVHAGRQLRSENAVLHDAVVRGQEGSKNLSRQLRRQELKIQSLFELSQNVFGCLELEELYQGFLLTAIGQLGLSAGVLFHLDSSHGGRVIEVVSRGIPLADARRLLDFRAGLGAYLLRAPQPLVLGEDRCPRDLQAEVDSLRGSGFVVACPMASKGMPIGVALFGPKVSGVPLGVDDLVMLSAVCNFAGPALESARLFTELHHTYLSTVRAFVSALEAKDTYTRGHSERVADYARAIGLALGMKKHDLDMLVFGAVLHDIGKIGVSEGILNKPAPLTPEEWRIVRAHPEMGARIVSHIEYLQPAVGFILHHHERIDGRGYPHGLSGDEIELGARIITAADSFDAMTTHRPYRRAMSVTQAVKLLKLHAGRQFDRQIVDIFIELIEAGTVTV